MWIQDPIVPCDRCGKYLDLLSGHEVHVEMQLEDKGWKKINGEWLCPSCIKPRIKELQRSGYRIYIENEGE